MPGQRLLNRVTAVAITPGFMRSEAVHDHCGVTEANWRDAIERDTPPSETDMDLFVVRTRLYQVEADPAAAADAARLRAYLERHR